MPSIGFDINRYNRCWESISIGEILKCVFETHRNIGNYYKYWIMETFLFGKSENGLAISATTFGQRGRHVFILGGVHGDEIEGVALAKSLISDFSGSFEYSLQVTVLSCLNIDGLLLGTRQNANGIDLNRNLPTKDWDPESFNDRYFPGKKANSELENRSLVEFIENRSIDFILSLHSFNRALLNVNGVCEPFDRVINEVTGLPIEESIGYPTPGCLGTYAGLERDIPTITYELPRGADIAKVINLHGNAIKKSLAVFDSR